jgi:hypothetical protein
MMRRYLSTALIIALLCVVGIPVALARAQDAAKPVITVKVEGKEAKGVAGSYCWTTENPPCDVVDSPEPKAEIVVKPGDPVEFVITPAPEKLESFKATLLDDLDTTGNPVTFDLAANKNIYTVAADLKPGKHRIQAEAAYPADAGGNQNFVFYAFLLNIQGNTVVIAPTSAAGTEVATLPATAVSTVAATPGATVEATVGVTVQVTMVSTPAATESATASATVETATATPLATTAATQPATALATTAATQAAIQAATVAATSAVTAAPPTATPIPPTVAPTASPIPTTAVPPTATPVPATIAPTTAAPTSTPVPLPTLTQSAANGLPAPDTVVPPMTLTIGTKEYKPIAIEGCEVRTGGLKICVSGPVNTNATIVEAIAGSDAIYIFKGTQQPTEVKLVTFGADGTRPLSQTPAPAGNVVLVTMPTTPGIYVLSIEVVYPSGRATYFFRVSVKK